MSQSQEEVQEVMQALEELAISYDNKDIEIQTLNKENMALLTMNESLRVSVISGCVTCGCGLYIGQSRGKGEGVNGSDGGVKIGR